MNLTEKIVELLEIEKFQSYLETQASEAIAGISGNCYHCPIAQYLKHKVDQIPEAYSIDGISVTCQRISYADEDLLVWAMEPSQEEYSNAKELPQWVTDFVAVGDSYFNHEEITFKEAIAILNQL